MKFRCSNSNQTGEITFVAVDGGLSDTEEQSSYVLAPKAQSKPQTQLPSVKTVSSLKASPLFLRTIQVVPSPKISTIPLQVQLPQATKFFTSPQTRPLVHVPTVVNASTTSLAVPLQSQLLQGLNVAHFQPKSTQFSKFRSLAEKPKVSMAPSQVSKLLQFKAHPLSQMQAAPLQKEQPSPATSHLPQGARVSWVPLSSPLDSENAKKKYILVYRTRESSATIGTTLTSGGTYRKIPSPKIDVNYTTDDSSNVILPQITSVIKKSFLKIVKCRTCSQQFPSKIGFQIHKSLFHRNNIVSSLCEVCGKLFQNKFSMASLKSHLQTQHGGPLKPVSMNCNLCSKHFTSRGGLRRHVEVFHKGVLRLCEICGKKFTSLSSLKSHERNHRGEKPFPCKYCKKPFVDKKLLIVHERVHTKEKPYVCQLCSNSYSQITSLKVHVSTAHGKERPFACLVCSKRFVIKSLLNSHMKIHANKSV